MTTRKSFAGAAVRTTIASGVVNPGDTTFTLTSVAGWPTTAGGPFVATIDRGLTSEEKVLVATRAGSTCSSVTRGYDGTVATAHVALCAIEHTLDSVTVDEANRIASLLTAKGDVITHDGTLVQRLAVGVNNGQVLSVNSAAANGVAWGVGLGNLLTTKGDLATQTSVVGVPVRHGVGTNGQVLTADSAQATGLSWTTPAPVSSLVPTGSVTMFGATTAPTGWLACDGAAVSRSTYAALFSVIGTTYGVGDNSTTFNVPNLKQKVPVGYDAGTAPFNALAATGGAASIAIASANLPVHLHSMNHDHPAVFSGNANNSHSHAVTDPQHNHAAVGSDAYATFVASGAVYTAASPGGILLSGVGGVITQPASTGITLGNETFSHDHNTYTGTRTQDTGDGGFANTALATRDPYVVMAYIIKT